MTHGTGFTLLEILIVIVIFTTGVVILLGSVATIVSASGGVENVNIATTLARDLMDEIVGKSFQDPDGGLFGLEEVEPRSNFDDVDDYDGWSKNPPEDINGLVYDGTLSMPNYARFTREVTVENVPEDDFNTSTPSSDGTTDAKRIVVTVSWEEKGGRPKVELRSVVTEYHLPAR